MTLVKVESEVLEAVGYEHEVLRIRFKPSRKRPAGAVYDYADVPVTKHEGLMAAESKGQFFNEQIRNREEHPATQVFL